MKRPGRSARGTAVHQMVVRREIDIDAPPERIWPYVGTAEGYRSWSCPPAEVHEVTLEPRAGGRFEDRMVVRGRTFHGIGEVVEYDPPRRIVLSARSVEGHLSSVVDTITITLTTIDGRTRVTVEHAGFEQLPIERQEPARKTFDEGWARALEALRELTSPATGRQVQGAIAETLVIRKEIEIEAPPDRVWSYVATQEGCRRWFCTVAEVYDLVLEPRTGGRFEDHMVVVGKTYRSVGEIVTYDPPRRLVYRYRGRLADGSQTSPNTVSITLIDEHGHTRVVVEETGFDQPADVRMRRFTSTDQGWEAALEDARAILLREVLPDLGHLLIYQSTEIAAPASRIWELIATPEGRLQMQRTKYPSSHLESDVFEARGGGRWESAGVSAQTGDRYRQFGRILRYEPPHLLVYTLQEDGWPDETLVTYRLIEYFGRTRVTLTHSGFEKLPPRRHLLTRKAYEIGRYGTLERLRLLVEGQAVPVEFPLMIRKEVVIDAPIDRVWWYVGTQAGSLARHRAENTPGVVEYQDEILEERPGGRYELRGVFRGARFRIVGQVLAYDPPHALALSWREESTDGSGWPVDTVVRFRLEEEGGRTHVTVIHHGFEHLPVELRDQALQEYDAGRQRGLDVLRTLVESSRR